MAPRAAVGGQLPTRMVLRNVSNEVKQLGLSISLNRLNASARTPEGNLLRVRKVMLRGADAIYKVTLKPNEQGNPASGLPPAATQADDESQPSE
jgi:hypothetical protein